MHKPNFLEMLTFGATVGGMFECVVFATLVLYLLFIQRNKKNGESKGSTSLNTREPMSSSYYYYYQHHHHYYY